MSFLHWRHRPRHNTLPGTSIDGYCCHKVCRTVIIPPLTSSMVDVSDKRKFTTSSPQWYSANKIESGDDKPRSRLVQLFQKSKALVVFYKDGLKQLWANHKQAKALKLRVQQEGHVLTRSEYQLVYINNEIVGVWIRDLMTIRSGEPKKISSSRFLLA